MNQGRYSVEAARHGGQLPRADTSAVQLLSSERCGQSRSRGDSVLTGETRKPWPHETLPSLQDTSSEQLPCRTHQERREAICVPQRTEGACPVRELPVHSSTPLRFREGALQGRFSGRLKLKADEKVLMDRCRQLGPLLGGCPGTGGDSLSHLSAIVRGVASGQVYRMLHEREELIMEQRAQLADMTTTEAKRIQQHRSEMTALQAEAKGIRAQIAQLQLQQCSETGKSANGRAAEALQNGHAAELEQHGEPVKDRGPVATRSVPAFIDTTCRADTDPVGQKGHVASRQHLVHPFKIHQQQLIEQMAPSSPQPQQQQQPTHQQLHRLPHPAPILDAGDMKAEAAAPGALSGGRTLLRGPASSMSAPVLPAGHAWQQPLVQSQRAGEQRWHTGGPGTLEPGFRQSLDGGPASWLQDVTNADDSGASRIILSEPTPEALRMDLAEGLAPWWSHDATAPLAAASPEPMPLVQAVEEDDSLVPWPPPVPRPAQPSTNTALPPSQGQDVPSMPGRTSPVAIRRPPRQETRACHSLSEAATRGRPLTDHPSSLPGAPAAAVDSCSVGGSCSRMRSLSSALDDVAIVQARLLQRGRAARSPGARGSPTRTVTKRPAGMRRNVYSAGSGFGHCRIRTNSLPVTDADTPEMLLTEDAEEQPQHAVQSSPALPCGLRRNLTHHEQRSVALAESQVPRVALEQPQMHLAVNGISARPFDLQQPYQQPLVVLPQQQTQQMQPAQHSSFRALPHQATPQLADWQGQHRRQCGSSGSGIPTQALAHSDRSLPPPHQLGPQGLMPYSSFAATASAAPAAFFRSSNAPALAQRPTSACAPGTSIDSSAATQQSLQPGGPSYTSAAQVGDCVSFAGGAASTAGNAHQQTDHGMAPGWGQMAPAAVGRPLAATLAQQHEQQTQQYWMGDQAAVQSPSRAATSQGGHAMDWK